MTRKHLMRLPQRLWRHASVALRAKFDVKKIDACELSVKKYQLASSMQILLTYKSARRQPHIFSSKEPKNNKERSSRLNFSKSYPAERVAHTLIEPFRQQYPPPSEKEQP